MAEVKHLLQQKITQFYVAGLPLFSPERKKLVGALIASPRRDFVPSMKGRSGQ
jgi:hypothetical protein